MRRVATMIRHDFMRHGFGALADDAIRIGSFFRHLHQQTLSSAAWFASTASCASRLVTIANRAYKTCPAVSGGSKLSTNPLAH
jgi:hypothetical protein